VDSLPVVLVHGWGGSFARTWRDTGWVDLLADEGREVIGVDLLGHGDAPKPHEPGEYVDLTLRVLDAIGDHEQVDAIGFSLGAMTLLDVAAAHPPRIRRLVVGGVGENIFRDRDSGHDRVIAAVEGRGDADDASMSDVGSQVFAQYARQPGNDAAALAACLRRPAQPFTAARLATVTMPTLVVLGERDFAGPIDPLLDALANATGKVLPRVDHFATTEAFGFIDAALAFLR
jgi:pimeloyl-ACP methyl ester carboxylesterase